MINLSTEEIRKELGIPETGKFCDYVFIMNILLIGIDIKEDVK